VALRDSWPGLRIPAQTLFSFLHIADEDSQTIRFALACVLICGAAGDLFPANMRSFVEFVRRQAPVVYVDFVKEARALQRTKFDIKAKAVVDVKEVIRSTGSNPQQASIEYSPMLEGGPQISTATRRLSSNFCELV
jgi:hypothetical protein